MAAEIVHIEFKSGSFTRTTEFYSRLFGWRTAQNASATYMKLDSAAGPSGGWVRADLVQSPGPIPYLAVADLDATLTEVERAGGRVLVRSMPFAGGGEVGLFADPDGNVLGLWRRKDAQKDTLRAAPEAAAGSGTAPVDDGKPAAKTARPAKAVAKPAAKAKKKK
jgi:uncharacterized protein